jgi:hypothetical protein
LGYNIYLADSPEAEALLYNNAPYPGDTDGDNTKESIELQALVDGKIYYVYIRTILASRKLSKPSKVATFRPLSQGRIEISSNHTSERSGYSFAKSKYTIVRDFDNDLYIYATSKKTGISSPFRLHTSLNKTLIKISNDSKSDYALTQLLKIGNNYHLKLANDGQATLTLAKFVGKNSQLKAVFDYIYYPPGVIP